jgi:hypothetical protein
MKTLIIILVVAMLVQTITYIYSHIFDINANKANGATIDMLNSAVQSFVQEKENFQKILNIKDENISKMRIDYNELVKNYNLLTMFLPNSSGKEAMRQVVNDKIDDSTKEILKEYLERLKNNKV